MDETTIIPKKKQKTSKSSKSFKLLYDPNLFIHYCDRYAFKKVERRFKCVFSIPQTLSEISDSLWLNVLVLDNKISLLVLAFPIPSSQFRYVDVFLEMNVSGKHKKGAKTVNVGDEVAKLSLDPSGRTISLKSPISGKIMELNDRLTAQEAAESVSSLTTEEIHGDGFIAVIASEAPRILRNNPEGSVALAEEKRDNTCFAWLKGECYRGSDCRFEHTQLA